MRAEVLIDVTRLVVRRLRGRLPTGIDRVGLAYLEHFHERARAVMTIGARALVLNRADSSALSARLLAPVSDGTGLPSLLAAAMRSSITPTAPGSWFLNTGHTGLNRPGYAAMLQRLGVRPLFLIHDLIPLTHPQFCRADEDVRHAARMRTALRSARAIVCNSRATADRLEAFAIDECIALPPATVALLSSVAPTPAAVAQARASVPPEAPYFLMVGTLEPRKNHLLMLQVWQRLVERLGARTPRLVLIGQDGWECEHVMRLMARAPGLRRHVLRVAHCDDAQLLRWLVHARALLMPSFAEGFGLPILEAMQIGVPVLAADLDVYHEFAGDAPEYLDPLDAAGWQAAIEAYHLAAGGESSRDRQLQRLTHWRGPDWGRHFDIVEDLMARIDGGAAQRPQVRPVATAEAAR